MKEQESEDFDDQARWIDQNINDLVYLIKRGKAATPREREKASPDDQTDMMRDQTRTRTIGNKRAWAENTPAPSHWGEKGGRAGANRVIVEANSRSLSPASSRANTRSKDRLFCFCGPVPLPPRSPIRGSCLITRCHRSIYPKGKITPGPPLAIIATRPTESVSTWIHKKTTLPLFSGSWESKLTTMASLLFTLTRIRWCETRSHHE